MAESPNQESPAEVPFPNTGRLLGVDYGSKRVGLAVSTPEQTIAAPVETYVRRAEAEDAQHLLKVVRDYRVAGLVVGLPVHLSGEEGGKASEARQFGGWMSRVTGLPVRFHDERYTTVQAEEFLLAANLTKKQRKQRVDMVAAQLLLQAYLESGEQGAPPEGL